MLKVPKQTIDEWRRDNVSMLAAALAYYTVFSLAPMLIVVIAMLTFFGQGDAQVAILQRIRDVAGGDAAQLVGTMIENRQASGGNVLATIVGLGLVLVGATGVLAQLQNALDVIWDVKPDPARSGVRHTLRARVKALLLILVAGVLLLAALLGTALLRSVAVAVREQVPRTGALLAAVDPMILLVVSGLVFALMFKYLPNVRIPWHPVLVGGSVTSVVFVIANWLLSQYLSRGAVAGAYGAAGALVAILLWVFVSAQILLLGAEFTKVYARHHGVRVVPDEHAVPRHQPVDGRDPDTETKRTEP